MTKLSQIQKVIQLFQQHPNRRFKAKKIAAQIIEQPHEPSESELFLPALKRPVVEWQSVNRIAVENNDFEYFVELVSVTLKVNA